MARTPQSQRVSAHQLRSTNHPSSSHRWKAKGEAKPQEMSLALEKKDWKGATCSVCMEHPHNAVLLLCSSHDKGCRPYMCGTNNHHSNCLEQFKKAYAKEKLLRDDSIADAPSPSLPPPTFPASKKSQVMELACPLCRGDVKGWTVVEPAREYLNRKRRTCMQDGCLFIGTYKQLCEHVRSEHPLGKPREVDPVRADKWKKFEYERERQDVLSIIRSANPGALIIGDYVIEMNSSNSDSDTDSYSDEGSSLSDNDFYSDGRSFFGGDYYREQGGVRYRMGQRIFGSTFSSVEGNNARTVRRGRIGLYAPARSGRQQQHHRRNHGRSGSRAS